MQEKHGVNMNTYRHYINLRQEPKFGVILQLCESLEVTLPYLLNYHLEDTTQQATQHKIHNIEKGIIHLFKKVDAIEKGYKAHLKVSQKIEKRLK